MNEVCELDDLNNLFEYCDIQAIKEYYKVSDLECELDQDIRGSIYNQIALKRLNKC